MSYDKHKLGLLLQEICAHTQSEYPPEHRRIQIIGGAGTAVELRDGEGKVFLGKMATEGRSTAFIVDEGCDAIDAFIDEALKAPELADCAGKVAIRKQLLGFIGDTGGQLPEGELADVVRHRILKPLRHAIKEWTVYVPILNLKLSQELDIGGVRLFMRSEGLSIAEWTGGRYDDQGICILADSKVPKLPNQITEPCRISDCWAAVTVFAHDANVSNVAYRTVERAINLLRQFTDLLFPRTLNRIFGIAGTVNKNTRTALSRDGAGNFKADSEIVGFLSPFELTDDDLRHLKEKCHFDRLCQIASLPPDKRNSLHDAILSACHWLGRAGGARRPEDELLWATIALERLLFTDNQLTTTEAFATKLSLIIADRYDVRLAVYQSAKRLYDVRSKIVHAGNADIAEDDMNEMKSHAITTLLRILGLESRLNSHEEFQSELTKRMLSQG